MVLVLLKKQFVKKKSTQLCFDKTNIPNDFQGILRYGYLEDGDQANRISKDWSKVAHDGRFTRTIAITHCNEFDCGNDNSKYFSDNPYGVEERK